MVAPLGYQNNTLQIMFRGPNSPNSKNHIIPKHKDILKHPLMKKHSCKPILIQIVSIFLQLEKGGVIKNKIRASIFPHS